MTITGTGPDLASFASTLQRTQAPSRAPTDLASAGVEPTGATSFAERVQDVLEEVNATQVNADNAAEAFANGERNDMHGTMIALEQADITLRLVSNVRSRLVEAYREVMRMGA